MSRKPESDISKAERTKSNSAVIVVIVAVIIFAASVAGYAIYNAIAVPISDDTEKLMNDVAGTVDDNTSERIKNARPISNDTRKLITGNSLVLQNPDFMNEGEFAFKPVLIDTEEQLKIIDVIEAEWPETMPPWENGYMGLCLNWVCDIYKDAGIPVKGSCCAASSRLELADDSPDIPVGALIYSDDSYESGTLCEICGNDPGHVAIYIGDGKVAGSQSQYIMTLKDFKEMFGYGGWSFCGNLYQ